MDINEKRSIRSFVLRQGRMTPAQSQAFEQAWPRYGLDYQPQAYDLSTVFKNDGLLVCEIGFGMGDSLIEQALAVPQNNYIGIEVHRPGVGSLLNAATEQQLKNLRVFNHDAVAILTDCFSDASIDQFQIYFPDPWHKKRHNKRRLIQPDFVNLLVKKLKPGGLIHLATDWQDYAEQMLAVLDACPQINNLSPERGFIERPESRPETKFEKRGKRLGHGVWDLLFEKPGYPY